MVFFFMLLNLLETSIVSGVWLWIRFGERRTWWSNRQSWYQYHSPRSPVCEGSKTYFIQPSSRRIYFSTAMSSMSLNKNHDFIYHIFVLYNFTLVFLHTAELNQWNLNALNIHILFDSLISLFQALYHTLQMSYVTVAKLQNKLEGEASLSKVRKLIDQMIRDGFVEAKGSRRLGICSPSWKFSSVSLILKDLDTCLTNVQIIVRIFTIRQTCDSLRFGWKEVERSKENTELWRHGNN